MKNKIFILAAILALLSSCDSGYMFSGKVVRATDKQPVTNAKIITAEKSTTHTDSLGNFTIHSFGPGSHSDKAELLVEKEGYQSEYVDLSDKATDIHNIRVELTGSGQPQETAFDSVWVRRMYLFNLIVINLIAAFTLLFLFIRKIKYRWFWMMFILAYSIVIRVNYINGATEVDFFNLPFFFKHYGFYPFTIKIAIPFSIIVFWMAYFAGRVRRR